MIIPEKKRQSPPKHQPGQVVRLPAYLYPKGITMRYTDMTNAGENIETVMTLIDLSYSMEAEDWKPTRVDGAVAANNELINRKLKSHPEDKMGIIVFGDDAKLLHPAVCLKQGAQSLKRALGKVKYLGATNFTAALNLAEKCLFGKSSQISGGFFSNMLAGLFTATDDYNCDYKSLKRIIMLTDGEHNHKSSPVPVAKRLKKAGVIIDCIGIGGTPRDVDEELLKNIASKNPDGSARYCFIGSKQQLISKYKTLSSHIQAV